MSLHIVPISIRDANAVVERLHRHNKPVRVARFACACADDAGEIRGVAIVGSPSACPLCDGRTVEVLRVATDGARNACSILYGACIRAARALGYNRVVTYTLHSESGSSLRAVGFSLDTDCAGGRPWTTNTQRRRSAQNISLERKNRWSVTFAPASQEGGAK